MSGKVIKELLIINFHASQERYHHCFFQSIVSSNKSLWMAEVVLFKERKYFARKCSQNFIVKFSLRAQSALLHNICTTSYYWCQLCMCFVVGLILNSRKESFEICNQSLGKRHKRISFLKFEFTCLNIV
jgi:hypothetical protein